MLRTVGGIELRSYDVNNQTGFIVSVLSELWRMSIHQLITNNHQLQLPPKQSGPHPPLVSSPSSDTLIICFATRLANHPVHSS